MFVVGAPGREFLPLPRAKISREKGSKSYDPAGNPPPSFVVGDFRSGHFVVSLEPIFPNVISLFLLPPFSAWDLMMYGRTLPFSLFFFARIQAGLISPEETLLPPTKFTIMGFLPMHLFPKTFDKSSLSSLFFVFSFEFRLSFLLLLTWCQVRVWEKSNVNLFSLVKVSNGHVEIFVRRRKGKTAVWILTFEEKGLIRILQNRKREKLVGEKSEHFGTRLQPHNLLPRLLRISEKPPGNQNQSIAPFFFSFAAALLSCTKITLLAPSRHPRPRYPSLSLLRVLRRIFAVKRVTVFIGTRPSHTRRSKKSF